MRLALLNLHSLHHLNPFRVEESPQVVLLVHNGCEGGNIYRFLNSCRLRVTGNFGLGCLLHGGLWFLHGRVLNWSELLLDCVVD